MKKILFSIITLIFLISCERSTPTVEEFKQGRVKIVIIDSCEYFQYDANYQLIEHRGRCKFCIQRQNKTLMNVVGFLAAKHPNETGRELIDNGETLECNIYYNNLENAMNNIQLK